MKQIDTLMNTDKQSINIAYLTSHDPVDKRRWSGITYCIGQTLQRNCGDVSYLGPIDAFYEKLIGLALQKSSKIFFKKTFVYKEGFLVARRYAKIAGQKLTKQPADVIVAVAGVPEVAFLETDTPIVLVADATYASLLDYYPRFSNVLKRSIYEMHTMQSLALQKASKIIFSSTWAAQSAIHDYHVDPGKVHVIPFGANLENPPDRELVLQRKNTGHCRLLFLAVDWERKGGKIAFDTLLHLEKMGIQAELIVCGCIPPKEFVHERMKVIPFLNKNDERQRKQLNDLFMTSDFLFLPTRGEAFGIVFCEASSYGLPSITTSTGGVANAVTSGENGYMLPLSAGGAEYAELIADIYHDNQRYTELVRSSRAVFEQRLNWDAWGMAVNNILTQLLEKPSVVR